MKIELSEIDLNELLFQKNELEKILEKEREKNKISDTNSNIQIATAGLIHLIDNIQDSLVVGGMDQEKVYGITCPIHGTFHSVDKIRGEMVSYCPDCRQQMNE